MLQDLPNYIAIIFGLTTLATLVMFYQVIKASSLSGRANIIALGMVFWLVVQLGLSLSHFYLNTIGDIPPMFPLFGFLPGIVLLIVLFNTGNGKVFIDSLPLDKLTWISVIRIPVEIVLYLLFINKVLPELLTFEGRNFDILAGLSAPVIAYFGFVKGWLSKKFLLGWNILCLILLINIVTLALFSFPSAFQQFAFEQPNFAILFFPFSWLPSFVVPIVFFAHFTSIRQLLANI